MHCIGQTEINGTSKNRNNTQNVASERQFDAASRTGVGVRTGWIGTCVKTTSSECYLVALPPHCQPCVTGQWTLLRDKRFINHSFRQSLERLTRVVDVKRGINEHLVCETCVNINVSDFAIAPSRPKPFFAGAVICNKTPLDH